MKNLLETLELPFWKGVTKLVVLNLVVFSVMMLFAPEHIKTQYIPDDAFYYLTLSRNFTLLRFWTFDSGISVTSGFHPLLAYLLAAIYSLIQPDVTGFVFSGLVLSLVFGFASVYILVFIGFEQKNVLFFLFVALILSSRNFIYNMVSITEWSLTLLITLLYSVYFFRNFRERSHFTQLVVLFMLGAIGSIARADFGLFPVSIGFTMILLFSIRIASIRHVVFSMAGALGAVVGLLGVFTHNYLFTEEFLQSSAKMKAYWAEIGSFNYLNVANLYLQILELFGFFILILITIKVLVYIVYILRTNSGKRPFQSCFSDYLLTLQNETELEQVLMIVSSSICLLGYSFVYTGNGAIQPWYSVNLIIPFMLFVLGVSKLVLPVVGEKTRLFFMLFFLLAFFVRLISLYPLGVGHAPWPHQEVMRTAGIYLKENEESFINGRIGAWNAGIIGYYQGGTIVNLDGLVNNSIYPFVVTNDLPSYLAAQNINYIVDFERMFTTDTRRINGGFDNVAFLEKLVPIKEFNDNGANFWTNLALYQIDNP